MILRVTIGNLFSFREDTEICFVAGKSDLLPTQVKRAEKRDEISVLKAGLIYGANASGKSNIIKAIHLLQYISLKHIPINKIEPFKLANMGNKASKVEIEIKIGKHYYAYGIEFNRSEIVEEWLYQINSRKDTKIFERKTNTDENNSPFGISFKNDEDKQLATFIYKSTPKNTCFLSEYIKRNGEGIKAINEVYIWLKDNLKIIFPETKYQVLSIRTEKDKLFANATKQLLRHFNTGIVDIRKKKIAKEYIDLPKDLVNDILSEAEPGKSGVLSFDYDYYIFETNKSGITSIYKQITIHAGEGDKEIPFEMNEESDGSLRIMDFIPMLIDMQLNDAVYLIDEIDRSMHPLLSWKVLEYYLTHLTKDKDTQLIVSTHESNLLDLNLIRADEVWFVEKGRDGASHLTSLAEYKPREDVRKGYLQGRYGAIPFFTPMEKLNW